VDVIENRPNLLDSAHVGRASRSHGLQAGDLVPATAATVSRMQTLREAAQRMVERGARI
jgi:hypothetical protein